jgi:hypothetical protein
MWSADEDEAQAQAQAADEDAVAMMPMREGQPPRSARLVRAHGRRRRRESSRAGRGGGSLQTSRSNRAGAFRSESSALKAALADVARAVEEVNVAAAEAYDAPNDSAAEAALDACGVELVNALEQFCGGVVISSASVESADGWQQQQQQQQQRRGHGLEAAEAASLRRQSAAEEGAVEALLALLMHGGLSTRARACTALSTLALEASCAAEIALGDGIRPLVRMLAPPPGQAHAHAGQGFDSQSLLPASSTWGGDGGTPGTVRAAGSALEVLALLAHHDESHGVEIGRCGGLPLLLRLLDETLPATPAASSHLPAAALPSTREVHAAAQLAQRGVVALRWVVTCSPRLSAEAVEEGAVGLLLEHLVSMLHDDADGAAVTPSEWWDAWVLPAAGGTMVDWAEEEVPATAAAAAAAGQHRRRRQQQARAAKRCFGVLECLVELTRRPGNVSAAAAQTQLLDYGAPATLERVLERFGSGAAADAPPNPAARAVWATVEQLERLMAVGDLRPASARPAPPPRPAATSHAATAAATSVGRHGSPAPPPRLTEQRVTYVAQAEVARRELLGAEREAARSMEAWSVAATAAWVAQELAGAGGAPAGLAQECRRCGVDGALLRRALHEHKSGGAHGVGGHRGRRSEAAAVADEVAAALEKWRLRKLDPTAHRPLLPAQSHARTGQQGCLRTLWQGVVALLQLGVSRAFPSCTWSILAEIDLCHACSYHEIEDGNARTGTRGSVAPLRLGGAAPSAARAMAEEQRQQPTTQARAVAELATNAAAAGGRWNGFGASDPAGTERRADHQDSSRSPTHGATSGSAAAAAAAAATSHAAAAAAAAAAACVP